MFLRMLLGLLSFFCYYCYLSYILYAIGQLLYILRQINISFFKKGIYLYNNRCRLMHFCKKYDYLLIKNWFCIGCLEFRSFRNFHPIFLFFGLWMRIFFRLNYFLILLMLILIIRKAMLGVGGWFCFTFICFGLLYYNLSYY